MLRTALFASVAGLALAAPANADDTYVAISGGAVFAQDSDNVGAFNTDFTTGAGTTIPGGTVLPAGTSVGWTTEFDVGYAVQGAFGRRYGPFRGEVEVGYQINKVDTHVGVAVGGGAIGTEDAGVLITGSPNIGASVADVVADGQGDLGTIFAMVNGYYDFENASPLTPYVGAGVGVGFVDVEYRPSGVNIIDDDATVFAYQAMAGASLEVGPGTEIYAGYRYRATTGVEVDAVLFDATFDVDNRAHIAEAGIRYSF